MTEDLAGMVDEDLSALSCLRCEGQGITLSETGPHIKASCARCGAYIKFCRQKLPPAERAYWDSRKSP